MGQELEVLSATGTLIRLMDLAMATRRYSSNILNTGHKSVRLGYLGDALTRCRLALRILGLWPPCYTSFFFGLLLSCYVDVGEVD